MLSSTQLNILRALRDDRLSTSEVGAFVLHHLRSRPEAKPHHFILPAGALLRDLATAGLVQKLRPTKERRRTLWKLTAAGRREARTLFD